MGSDNKYIVSHKHLRVFFSEDILKMGLLQYLRYANWHLHEYVYTECIFEEKRVAILAFLRLIRIVWVIRMGIVIVLYKRHRGFMPLRRFLANTNQMKFEFRDIFIWTESK